MTPPSAHPWKPPRPVGTIIYGEPYNDPPGSMFLYRTKGEIVAHENIQCWEDWKCAMPIEVIVFRGREAYQEPVELSGISGELVAEEVNL